MRPSIRVRAPGRVNLIGDHTDYTGGLVLPMAIDRWTDVRGVVADSIRLRSDADADPVDIPTDPDATLIATLHPTWGRFVAAVAAELDDPHGIDGSVSTTIPVGAGLSSSAALEVAIALALGFRGSPRALAELTRRAEHVATGVPTGIMDQLCIASATDGHATLIDCHSLAVEHVVIPDDLAIVVRFVAHRTLEGSEYAQRVRECAAAEDLIGPLRSADVDAVESIDDDVIRRRARHVVTENERVRAFAAALVRGDYTEAGRLMVRGHDSLRADFEVSTPAMDAAVHDALGQPGVFGCRMTGGGFGGCVVALCRPDTTLDGMRVRAVAGAAVLG